MNLGDPLGRQKVGNSVVRLSRGSKEVRLHGSTDEASNDRGGKALRYNQPGKGHV